MPRAIAADALVADDGFLLNPARGPGDRFRAGPGEMPGQPLALPLAPRSAVRPRPASRDGAWTATSLFSGCGGLDLGFSFEGIVTGLAYDHSPDAVGAFNANHRPVARRADLGAALPEIGRGGVLLAGAPCQGFSTNGRRDVDDRRNDLLGAIDAACERARPQVVVVENVPAALSGAHAMHWLRLEARLASLGYNVRRVVVEAEDHGVAQHRRRLFLIAWLGSDCIGVRLGGAPRSTLRDALARMGRCTDHHRCPLSPDTEAGRIAERIAPGQKLSNVRLGGRNVATWDLPEVFGETSSLERVVLVAVTRLRRRQRRRPSGDGDPVGLGRLSAEVGFDAGEVVAGLVARRHLRKIGDGLEHRHTYNGKFRRLEWGSVSPTVDTRFTNPRLFLHPAEHRGATLREAMRIQGFPDWFELPGSKRARAEMVGNAVPPPLASAVAAFVREALLKA